MKDREGIEGAAMIVAFAAVCVALSSLLLAILILIPKIFTRIKPPAQVLSTTGATLTAATASYVSFSRADLTEPQIVLVILAIATLTYGVFLLLAVVLDFQGAFQLPRNAQEKSQSPSQNNIDSDQMFGASDKSEKDFEFSKDKNRENREPKLLPKPNDPSLAEN